MSLAGVKVGISISDAQARERLGYPEHEIDRVLVTVCTELNRDGARVVYGGDLRADGYTFKIFRCLARAYSVHAGDPPFIHVLRAPILLHTKFEALATTLREARGVVETMTTVGQARHTRLVADGDGITATWHKPNVDADGRIRMQSAPVFQDWVQKHADEDPGVRSFTRTRNFLTELCDARIVMGGKMGLMAQPSDHYQGTIPGILEEALLTLEARKPLVVFGASGGAARDLAIDLGLLEEEKVPRGEQMESYGTTLQRFANLRNAYREAHQKIWDQLVALAREDRAEALAYGSLRALEQLRGAEVHPELRAS